MEIDIYKALFAAAIGIISWFLKGLINDVRAEVKALELNVSKNSENIAVLKSDHGNLSVKIDEIAKDTKEIGLYIRNLNQTR